MEFKLQTNLETELPATINFNFEEIEEELSIRLVRYNEMVVTEESIKESKADRAKLNKLLQAIDNRRKEIKAQYLEPYNAFEARVKELIGMIDQSIKSIDGQVKKFDEAAKEGKKKEIIAIYGEIVGDVRELLPIEKLWDYRWLNVTYPIKDIRSEIQKAITTFNGDMAVIEGLNTEFSLQVKDKYLKTLNLSTALAENKRLQEQKAKLEAFKAQSDACAERAKATFMQPVKEPKTVNVLEVPPMVATLTPDTELAVEALDFRVWVTKDQKRALKEFLITSGIKYGRVPNVG